MAASSGQPGVGLDDSRRNPICELSRLRQRVAPGRSCQANIRVVDLAVARHVDAEVSVRYQTTSRIRPDRLEVSPVDSAIPVDVTRQLSKGDGRGGQCA